MNSFTEKKGQVTLFILLGLLVLGIVIMFLFLLQGSETVKPDELVSVDTQSIEFMIQDCVRDVATEGMHLLAKNGNYIPGIPKPLQFEDTSYWITEYNNVQPILTSSYDEFAFWFNYNFEQCVDYSPFLGFVVEAGIPNSSVEFAGEQVLIKVDYPVNVSKDGGLSSFEKWDEVLNIRYRRMYERAKHITEVHFRQDFDYRDPMQFVEKHDFDVQVTIVDQNNLVWTIIDPIEFEGQTFEFNFATNLNRSLARRTAALGRDDTRCLIPFTMDSPDRLATVTVLCGTTVIFPDGTRVGPEEAANSFGTMWSLANYDTVAQREITTGLRYNAGGSVSLDYANRETVDYVLTHPIYNFGPSGLSFEDESGNPAVQPLTIYWDDEKNPNYGPMGLLYRSERTGGEWYPIPVTEDYQQSSLTTNVPGFSDFAPVDCSFQECKEATVTSKIKGASGFKCFLKILFDVFFFDFGTGILDSLNDFWSDLFGLTADDSDESSITIDPTCDQVVDAVCSKSGKARGFGYIGGQRVGLGISQFTAEGGIPAQFTAVAKKCKMKRFKCKGCSVTCRTAYK